MNRLLSFLMLLILAGSESPASAEDAAQSLAACKAAQQQGRNAEAINAAQNGLKTTPQQRELLLCLGRAQAALDQYDEAIASFAGAEGQSATAAEHVVALSLMGNQYRAKKAYPEALAAYQSSLNYAQNARLAHYQRVNLIQIGETQAAMGDVAGALQSYLKAQKLAANDNERADVSAHIAAASSTLGQHSQAIEYQIKVLMMEERSGEFDHYARAGVEMGRIYLAAQEFANAEKALDKTIKLSSEAGASYWEAKALLVLAQVHAARKDLTQAREVLRRAQAAASASGDPALLEEIDRVAATW